MKKAKFTILSISIFTTFYACTHKPPVIPTTTKTLTPVTPVTPNENTFINLSDTMTSVQTDDTSVCFQRDVLPIFLSSCAISGCHDLTSRKKGYIFNNYTNIRAMGLLPWSASASKVYTTCVSGKMPQSPVPKLNTTQLSLIRRWIEKGAPNDTNCSVICDTTNFTYTNAIVPILSNNCYSCHSSASAATSGGGFILDNYNGVYAQAHNGKLLGDLQHATGFNAMPLGGIKLSDCKITQVTKWIQAGALNN
jgi:hypothetical protein